MTDPVPPVVVGDRERRPPAEGKSMSEPADDLIAPGQIVKSLAEWLRDSLCSELLFGRFDEPLDDDGTRLVRAILVEVEAADEAELAELGRLRTSHQQELDDFDEGYGYLSRLFLECAPQCEVLPTLPGLATQLDHYIAGLQAELGGLRTRCAQLEDTLKTYAEGALLKECRTRCAQLEQDLQEVETERDGMVERWNQQIHRAEVAEARCARQQQEIQDLEHGLNLARGVTTANSVDSLTASTHGVESTLSAEKEPTP